LRERLDLSGLPAPQQEEIVTELAHHLDDLCRHSQARGLSEVSAVQLALGELTDCPRLAQAIQDGRKEKQNMSRYTRQLWLPTLQTMAIAILLPPLFARALLISPIAQNSVAHSAIFHWSELALAFVAGSVGASASRRAGGSRFLRIVPGLLASLTCPLVIGCVALARLLDPVHFDFGSTPLGPMLTHYVMYPAVASVMGALLFFRTAEIEEAGVHHA